jgi:hypothetical protein
MPFAVLREDEASQFDTSGGREGDARLEIGVHGVARHRRVAVEGVREGVAADLVGGLRGLYRIQDIVTIPERIPEPIRARISRVPVRGSRALARAHRELWVGDTKAIPVTRWEEEVPDNRPRGCNLELIEE